LADLCRIERQATADKAPHHRFCALVNGETLLLEKDAQGVRLLVLDTQVHGSCLRVHTGTQRLPQLEAQRRVSSESVSCDLEYVAVGALLTHDQGLYIAAVFEDRDRSR
jgi:hypothetical protein